MNCGPHREEAPARDFLTIHSQTRLPLETFSRWMCMCECDCVCEMMVMMMMMMMMMKTMIMIPMLVMMRSA